MNTYVFCFFNLGTFEIRKIFNHLNPSFIMESFVKQQEKNTALNNYTL